VSNNVFYVLTIEVDPAPEQDWLNWYRHAHIPDILAQPGFRRATIYRAETAPGEWARYAIMFEVESRQALDAYLNGDEVQRLRADHYSHFGGVTRASRQILSPIE
jgi:quinol monooxygenase YgiN